MQALAEKTTGIRSHRSYDVAVALAARGIKTFPVVSGEKHPAIGGWQTKASTNSDDLAAWFSQDRHSVGIPTGSANGLIAIDIDAGKDGFASLAALEKKLCSLPPTVTVTTGGGGAHYYFAAEPDGSAVLNKIRLHGYCGVDVRGDGGLVVAPPSRHQSGKYYAWAEGCAPGEVPLAKLPPAWLSFLREKTIPSASSLPQSRSVLEGSRNDTLFRHAAALRARGAEGNDILADLRSVNSERCHPPLENRELESIASSALRYSPGYPLTELGNARRLIAEHGAEIRFNTDSRKWFHWKGASWVRDSDGAIERLMKSVADEMMREVLTVPEEAQKAAANWAKQSQSRNRIDSSIRLAQTEEGISLPSRAFDADPMILNARNGTVDLKTGQLRPHDRDDLLTKICAASFDEKAPCPLFEEFLDQIFACDRELISFVQRSIGYASTGDTSAQCLFVLFGSGANGKSVLLNTVREVLGDYAMQASMNTFMATRATNASNDIARLDGARFVTASEADEDVKFAESLIKQLTGGEPVTARYLFQEHFEFVPQMKLFMSTNHRPRLSASDEALWRRIHQIPFNVVIPAEKRDPNLARKLLAERDGILRWIVEGAISWRARGLQVPASVRNATGEYRQEVDDVGGFLDECCERGERCRAKATDIYTAYLLWCRAGGRLYLSSNSFGRDLTRRGFETIKVGGLMERVGIRLRQGSNFEGPSHV